MRAHRRRSSEGGATEGLLWGVLVAVLGTGIVLIFRQPGPVSQDHLADCGNLERRSGLGFIGLLVSASDAPDATKALRLGTGLKPHDVHRSSATCVFEMDSGSVLIARAAAVAFISAEEAVLESGELTARNGPNHPSFDLSCQGQTYRIGPGASLRLEVLDAESHRGTVLSGPVHLPSSPDLAVDGPLQAGQRLAFRNGLQVMRPSGERTPANGTGRETPGVSSICGLVRVLHADGMPTLADSVAHDYLLLTEGPLVDTTTGLEVDIKRPGRYFVQDATSGISDHVPPEAFIEADYASAVAPNEIERLPPGRYRSYHLFANTSVVTDKTRRLRGKILFSRPVAGLVTNAALLENWKEAPSYAPVSSGLDFDGIVLTEDRRGVELDLLAFDASDTLRILVSE